MNVLFVCTSLKLGGAERQWSSLVPSLIERGIDASVLALKEEGPVADELRAAGVRVECAHVRSRYDLRRLQAAARRIDTTLDAVVTRSIDAHVVGGFIARRSAAAHVATEHTHYDLLPLRRHQRALYRFAAPRVDAAVAVSPTQLHVLHSIGYPRSALEVIPNGVDAPAVTQSREVMRASLGLASSDIVFSLVAVLRPEKRADIFVDAVVQAHRYDPRVRGLVTGDGPDSARVSELCAASGRVVIALGARSDVGNVLAASDAACLTSNSEAFPLSLLEAASLGLPLVATDVGGVREIVRPGETGTLVPAGDAARFADALLAVASDMEAARASGGRARVLQRTQFAGAAMANAYEDLLRRTTVGRTSETVVLGR